MALKPNPFWPAIKYGDSGKNVTALQLLLQYRGYTTLAADGIFGDQTWDKVHHYQVSNNLVSQNGVAGEETLYRLIYGLEVQSRTINAAARAAQVLLSKFESITIDGDYYTASAQVALLFQQKMGFPDEELTGVVGIWTWYYLFGYDYYTSYDLPVANTVDYYSGNDILSPGEYTLINQNRSFYETAGANYGIPWQMIAAIHYREQSLLRFGPSNGFGPYQISGSSYPTGVYSDAQFQAATNDCANFIQGKIDDFNVNLTRPDGLIRTDGIKRVFYLYNGGGYHNQAIAKGFSSYEAQIGEGSPYVMNRADLPRDPTRYPTNIDNSWGQVKTDGGPIEYPANLDYGAYLVYCALLS